MAPTERGPSLAPSVPPSSGTAVAERYETLGLLGEGGMGRVERVRDRDLLREVAVKRLLPELLANTKLLRQFLWEARVTAYLDHPNIVPVHDLGVTPEGHLYFTMKLVKGRTLEQELEKVREAGEVESELLVNRRLRLFLQLCNAVSFAHSRGVLHRDLKPANVMVGEYGEILVTDWGIAVPLPDESGDALRALLEEASVGVSAGTPLYMSPEQVRGDAVDGRSDIYTLGVILYELVALRSPFDAKTVPTLLKQVTEGDSIPLRTAYPKATTAVAAVVAKAMALDPASRYAAVRELVADVETVLDGRTPSAEAAPMATRLARFYQGRDPGTSRMRVIDLDLWMVSSHFFGAGFFLLFSALVPVPWVWFWVFLLAGGLVAIKPTLSWWKLRRGDESAR